MNNVKIKKLMKLNALLCEYQGAILFSNPDKSSIAVTIRSVRDKINKYYFEKAIKDYRKCF